MLRTKGYGTAMLQIPSFVREIRNTRGCETLELVSCQDRLPVFAAVFGGITTEYAWSKIEAPKPVEECREKKTTAEDDIEKDAAERKDGAVLN
jgi:hypothetical protein